MEILIVALLLGLVAIIGLVFKFSADETKKAQGVEDAKMRKISDLEAETARKDAEMKKMMESQKRMEEDFYRARDEAAVFKKDNAELTQKIKSLEKAKEEASASRAEMRQKDVLLEQETVARQKLQGELSLKETESDKLKAEIEKLKIELKSKMQMYEGLQGQYNELESEIQKAREESLKKTASVTAPAALPKVGAPAAPVPAPAPPPTPEPVKPKQEPPAPAPEVKKEFELPGFPQWESPKKMELKKDVPSDTDFVKVEPAPKPAEEKKPQDVQPPEAPKQAKEGLAADVPEGAFKLTNVNKPAPVPPPQEKKAQDKDKQKSKRETLIPGFHPKDHGPDQPPPSP